MQIRQVFRNLINNGVKAMAEVGTLTIRAAENKPSKQELFSFSPLGSHTGYGVGRDHHGKE